MKKIEEAKEVVLRSWEEAGEGFPKRCPSLSDQWAQVEEILTERGQEELLAELRIAWVKLKLRGFDCLSVRRKPKVPVGRVGEEVWVTPAPE